MKSLLPNGRIVIGVLSIVGITLSASGCGGTGPSKVETPSGITVELVNSEHLTTCTNVPYPPFQFTRDGETVGFDVDIVNLAADKLEIGQEIVDIKFDSIKSGAAMAGGTCDLAAAGMTITPEREKNMTFSDPYFDEVIAFISPKGKKIESIDQVVDDGLTLGVQAASTSRDYASDNGVDPEQYEDSGKQLQALKSGTVDGVLQDLPVLAEWLKDEDFAADFELGAEIETGAQYGIGFKKDADPALVDVMNEAIAEAKSSGTYDEIFEEWFGSELMPS